MLWDDEHYLTERVLSSADGLRRIWFDVGSTEQYYPVVFSTLWVLHRFFGEATTGYHLLNIALHAGTAFLFALALRRLAVPGAALAAIIFALHPVHVESVAWITEFKNTYSGALFMGAALAYLHFDQSRRQTTYAAALGLFVLALLAKANTAVLPAGLLVVFWWQRGRLEWRRDVVPLLPFFAIGLAVGLGVAWVEHSLMGARTLDFQLGAAERLLIAGRAVWFYLAKLVWPVDLVFTYPRWAVNSAAWWQYAYPIALVALAAALWTIRARSRAPLAALAFFCVTIAPAAGVVTLYYFRYAFVADHYQYLAGFGVVALFAASVTTVTARWPVVARGAAVIVVALPLGLLTWNQAQQYANAETLYRATLARNPDSWMTHNNLGVTLDGQGRSAEAVPHLREAARLQTRYAEPTINLGDALLFLGQIEEGVAAFREAVRREPGSAKAHGGLGHALAEAGRQEEAVAEFTESLRLDSTVDEVHNNLGVVLDSLGRTDEAIVQYRAALAITPNWAEVRNNLGAALGSQGRSDEAAAQLAEAVRLNPDYADAHRNLGLIRIQQQRPADAIHEYREALRTAPRLNDVRYNLAVLLAAQGSKADAVRELETVLQLDPANHTARQLLDSLRR